MTQCTCAQALSRPLVQVVQALASIIEHFEALQLPTADGLPESSADLHLASSLWDALTADLFSAHAAVSAAQLDEASGHSGVLYFVSQTVQLSQYVDFTSRLSR